MAEVYSQTERVAIVRKSDHHIVEVVRDGYGWHLRSVTLDEFGSIKDVKRIGFGNPLQLSEACVSISAAEQDDKTRRA